MRPNSSKRTQIGTLVVATSGVQIAIGFFGTFIALRVATAGFEASVAGLVLSSYFAGFTAGAVLSGRIIERFGHIRTYAAFGGLVVVATVLMPLLVAPLSWMVLRAIIGVGCAGLFVTTESWLNAKAAPAERGRVFSIYMVGLFVALALGQLLIGVVEIETDAAFNIIVALFALALVMVSTTRAEPPKAIVTEFLPYGQLSRAAPVAVAGAVLSGFIVGMFYALVPIWMQEEGIEHSTIGLLMLTAVLGGLAFQIPVGRLSDRVDRLGVLFGLGIGLAVVSVVLVQLPQSVPMVLPATALFGGLMSTIYPVCVANAHDHMPADRVLAVSGRLILASGLGSALGPVVGMSVMQRFDIDGVFYLIAAAAAALAAVAAGRRLTVTPVPHLERTFSILTPELTPQSHDPAGATEK